MVIFQYDIVDMDRVIQKGVNMRKKMCFEPEYESMRECCMAYEKELRKLMGEDAFLKFSAKVARQIFKNEIKRMPDGDFKDFCMENFERITR